MKNQKVLIIGVIVAIVLGAIALWMATQSNSNNVQADIGFEKNSDVRKSADAESVAGCMLSCQDMLTGWLEMNPDSPNYTRQGEKIEAKAQQCLSMNELAGSPFSQEEILASCAEPHCEEVSLQEIFSGSCTAISFIEGANLPQCCGFVGPQGGRNCGEEEEWVVGIAAYPTCYIPGS